LNDITGMQKILKNTVVQWAGSALSKVVGLAFVLIITRGLGSEQYGKYNLVFTFLSFFTLLASFGIHTIAIREAAKKPEDAPQILGDVMVLSTVLSVMAGLLCILVSHLFGYQADILLGLKAAVVAMLFSGLQSHGIIFQARLKMEQAVAGNLIRDLFILVSAVYLSLIKAGFISYIWASVLAALASGAYIYGMGCRLVKPRFDFNSKRYAALLRESVPLGLSGIALYVYNYIDTIMLSKLAPISAVGYYGVAYKFVFLGQLLPGAILSTLFPVFSKFNSTDKERGKRYFQYTFDTIFTTAAFIAILGILYSWDLIILLFGREYGPSALPLAILCLNFVFMYCNMLFSKYLIATGQQTSVMIYMMITSGANLLVNFWAIPKYGVVGAAATTMMSEIIFFLLSWGRLYFREQVRFSLIPAVKVTLIAAALLFLAHLIKIKWFVEIIIMVFLYIAGTHFSGAYDYRKLVLLFNKSKDFKL